MSHPAKLEHPVVAAFYDAYMWPQEVMGFRRQRRRMGGEATGRVADDRFSDPPTPSTTVAGA